MCCDRPIINRPTVSPIQPQTRPPVDPFRPQTPPPIDPFRPQTPPPVDPFRPQTQNPEEIPPEVPVTQPTRRTTLPPTQPPTQPPFRSTSSPAISSSCRDPNSVSGVCMNIKECPSVLNEFVARSKDQNYIQYVKQSNTNCGNIQPYICCPSEGRNVEPDNNDPFPNSNEVRGRFLTIEEGCGFSNASHKRIVGGAKAKEGAWPWMALLGYVNNLGEQSWKCGMLE